MTAYRAPIDDIRFMLHEIADLQSVAALPGFEDATADLVDAILEEAGKFGAEVLAPLNRPGDVEGCAFENGVVRTPAGFKEAYGQFAEGGWNSIWAPEEWGGQGLPLTVATAVSEIWHAANMAFGLCPMLTQSAIELLLTHGSDELRGVYLKNLVQGTWTGTMNLTEPQAGSDLSRIRSQATRDGKHYLLKGQKIYITHGEHDMSENIVHMVLARTPDAPPGIKGISLFLVPKILVNDDGSLGARNDLRCVSIEHKMGIHASPTCVMSYGDNEGAVAYLVGEEHRGIEYMFTMMNNARLAVGLEGVGIAERAYQQARDYAKERIQGRDPAGKSEDGVAIIEHPDVQRMLLSMKVQTEAIRALAYVVAAALDKANHHPDEAVRAENQAFVDLMTPVVKAWSTDVGIEVANTGIQVHGGMGYIEETGAAQHLRDARIASIYEGTNGIQANDLVGRKIGREHGATVKAFIAQLRSFHHELEARAAEDRDLADLPPAFNDALDALEQSTDWIVETFATAPHAVAAGAVSYLRLLGTVAGGWLLNKAACRIAESSSDADLSRARRLSAAFYASQILPDAAALAKKIHSAGAALDPINERTF